MQYFQEIGRPSSVESIHTDPHKFSHIVDEDNHVEDKIQLINEADDEESYKLELSGEPTLDAATVARWVAKSYGETSRSYYEAYSREIFRQMRLLSSTSNSKSDLEASSTMKRSWF